VAKKAVAKKPVSKPVRPAVKGASKAAASAVKKPASKKAAPVAKAQVKKVEPKKVESKKIETKKPEVKKPELKKHDLKKSEAKKPEVKKVEAKKPEVKKADGKPVIASKTDVKAALPAGKKNITVVEKPAPSKKVKPPLQPMMPPGIGRLLMDGKGPRKPLISSGPKAAQVKPLGAHGEMYDEVVAPMAKPKTPFNKKQLEEFRQILLRKRGELAGDVVAMEGQALQGTSGALSNVPSHMAEQGSEAYDQSLSLELADKNRKLIREIDDALTRIEEASYGMCELTGKPIPIDRLTELPWVRYTIEAQREIDRQQMTRA
jgi:DnaK suppressor protein